MNIEQPYFIHHKNADNKLQELATDKVKNLINYYYLNQFNRQKMHDLIDNIRSGKRHNIDSIKSIADMAKYETVVHLKKIGLTMNENKDLINAFQKFNNFKINQYTNISEERLCKEEKIIPTIEQYPCFIVEDGEIIDYVRNHQDMRVNTHLNIMINHFRGVESQRNPQLYIVGGPLGAGKSTIINRLQNTVFQNCLLVDPNLLKPYLINGYNEGNCRHVIATHQESSWLAQKILDRAISGKANIVYETTLANRDKISRIIDQARKNNYQIDLLFVHGGTECWRRNSLYRNRIIKPRIFNRGFRSYLTLKDFCRKNKIPINILDNSKHTRYSTQILGTPSYPIDNIDTLERQIPNLERYCRLAEKLNQIS